MEITNAAKIYIETAMKEAGINTLRFINAGSGCCGPNYQISLERAQGNDIIETVNDIEVAFDPTIVDVVKPLTLDVEGEDNDAGLIVRGGLSNC